MEKTIKGEVSRVSKYGFQINNESNWYNWLDPSKADNLHKGDKIEFFTNDKGKVIQTEVNKDLKVKNEPSSVEDSINKAVALKCCCSILSIDIHSSEEVWKDSKVRLKEMYNECLGLLK